MVDSKEFAVGVFDALARRRRLNLERITRDELHDFWLQISDQSFDARLQIFFDMYVRSCLASLAVSNPCRCVTRFLLEKPNFRVDTNVDGRITREEVQEVSGDPLIHSTNLLVITVTVI
jgi:respiratory burst oxidase